MRVNTLQWKQANISLLISNFIDERSLWKMSRGEIQAFIASLHAISSKLSCIKDKVHPQVYAELSAMENVLKKELDDGQKS